MTALTETLKVRIDAATKTELAVRADQSHRTQGAIVRLALRHYLNRWPEIEGEQTRAV